LLRFLLPRVPLWVQYVHLLKQFRHTALDTDISVQEHPNEIQFSFGKNPQLTGKFQLRQVLSKNTISEKKIIFDFQKTEFADVGFLGLLLLFLNHRKKAGNEFELRNCNKVTSIFQLCGFSKPEFLMEKINRAQ